jgi:hypothetical protein
MVADASDGPIISRVWLPPDTNRATSFRGVTPLASSVVGPAYVIVSSTPFGELLAIYSR